eukprot:11148804-Alexandrium_andersonii.AAC.1
MLIAREAQAGLPPLRQGLLWLLAFANPGLGADAGQDGWQERAALLGEAQRRLELLRGARK